MTNEFKTKRLRVEHDATAPDGSDVRNLLELGGGAMIHFELGPGQVSVAEAHRSVDEIWYFLSGRNRRQHAGLAGGRGRLSG